MGYVFAGYGISLAVLGLYSFRTVRRGRLLGRSLPPREKTWR